MLPELQAQDSSFEHLPAETLITFDPLYMFGRQSKRALADVTERVLVQICTIKKTTTASSFEKHYMCNFACVFVIRKKPTKSGRD